MPTELRDNVATLHIDNTVSDFAEWKAVFDKFDRFRAERRVRAYRLSQQSADPNRVSVDLDFDSVEDAEAFQVALEQVWQTPQSRSVLVAHEAPVLVRVMEQRLL